MTVGYESPLSFPDEMSILIHLLNNGFIFSFLDSVDIVQIILRPCERLQIGSIT